MKKLMKMKACKALVPLAVLAAVFTLSVVSVHAEEEDGQPITVLPTAFDNVFPLSPLPSPPGNLPLNPPTNLAPPTVFAEIQGNMLRIDVIDGFFNVEAVFVNGRRFNHRVDAALLIDVTDYVARLDTIAVYAVDFAGNRSSTVFVTPLPPETPPEIPTITPPGQATATDIIMGERGIEFFTFTTPAGNVFHMVVDPRRGNDNVYLLSAVTEWDLVSFAQLAEVPNPNNVAAGAAPQPPPPQMPPQMPQEEPPEEDIAQAPIQEAFPPGYVPQPAEPVEIPVDPPPSDVTYVPASQPQAAGGGTNILIAGIPLLVVGGAMVGYLRWKKMKARKEGGKQDVQEDADQDDENDEDDEIDEEIDETDDDDDDDTHWKNDVRNFERQENEQEEEVDGDEEG